MTLSEALDRLLLWILLAVTPLSAAAYMSTLNLLKDTPIVVCVMPDGDCDLPEESIR
jgi:hypothetical protein